MLEGITLEEFTKTFLREDKKGVWSKKEIEMLYQHTIDIDGYVKIDKSNCDENIQIDYCINYKHLIDIC